MALKKSDIKTWVKAAADAAKQETDPANQDAAIDAWAAQIAEAIGDAIKEGVDGTTVSFDLSTSSGPVTGTITLSANVT